MPAENSNSRLNKTHDGKYKPCFEAKCLGIMKYDKKRNKYICSVDKHHISRSKRKENNDRLSATRIKTKNQ